MKNSVQKLFTVLLIMGLVTGCGCSKNKAEEIKVNTSEGVIKNQTLEVFTFTNTSLTYQGNTSVLITTVTNTSSQTQYLEEFKIHVWDMDGSEIVVMSGYVGETIEPGGIRTISSSYGHDITSAASITYEIIR